MVECLNVIFDAKVMLAGGNGVQAADVVEVVQSFSLFVVGESARAHQGEDVQGRSGAPGDDAANHVGFDVVYFHAYSFTHGVENVHYYFQHKLGRLRPGWHDTC
jgi:hypothetical protein